MENNEKVNEENQAAKSDVTPPSKPTQIYSDGKNSGDGTENDSPDVEKRNRSNSLESLPGYVRQKLDDLIAQDKSCGEICRALQMKFKGTRGPELDNLLDSDQATYRRYVKKHEGRIRQMAADERTLQTDIKTLLEIKPTIDETANPTTVLENKKQALISLYEHCAARLRILEFRQGINFLDPQYERLILTFIKEQRSIVESLINLQDELRKDGINEFYSGFPSYTDTLFVTMNQIYEDLWGNQKSIDFHDELQRRMKEVLTRWLEDRNIKSS